MFLASSLNWLHRLIVDIAIGLTHALHHLSGVSRRCTVILIFITVLLLIVIKFAKLSERRATITLITV